MMRLLQFAVLALVSLLFGAWAGWSFVYVGLKALLPEPRGENFGGAMIWLGLMVLGGIAGSCVGILSVLTLFARQRPRPWPTSVWVGSGIGLIVGLGISFGSIDRLVTTLLNFQPFDQISLWWSTSFYLPFCTALGGGLGYLAAPKKLGRKFK